MAKAKTNVSPEEKIKKAYKTGEYDKRYEDLLNRVESYEQVEIICQKTLDAAAELVGLNNDVHAAFDDVRRLAAAAAPEGSTAIRPNFFGLVSPAQFLITLATA